MKSLLRKSIFLAIAIASMFIMHAAIGQTITITNVTPTTFCATTPSNVTINFSFTGFSGQRNFTAQLSNSSGSFTSPTPIGAPVMINTSSNSSGTITGPIIQAAGTYLIRVTATQGSTPIFSPTSCIVIFPAAPIITAPANTCASAFTLPTVTPVPGFNVQYSIDEGAFSASPSTTTPGCHTVQARFVLGTACGDTPAGTAGTGGCGASNTVNVVIFPAAPPAPIVSPGCGPFTVIPPPTVDGFNIQYSFNDGATWGANTPPTADNCAGYRIRTRYVLAATCGSTPAGTASTNPACAASPATTRIVDTQDPTVSSPVGEDANIGCNPSASQINDAFTAPAFADNCGAPTVAVTNAHTGSGCQQSDTRTWTATDACGNVTAVSQTISYTIDTQDPTVSTPEGADDNIGCNPSASQITGAFTAPAFADNCGAPTVAVTNAHTGSGCQQSDTRTWTATDACGNVTAVSQTISYTIDTQAPTPNCPSDMTVAPTTLSGTVVNYTTPTATDNCGGTPSRVQTSGRPSGATFPIGTTTNTYEFTDACGNKSTCTFKITVTDPYCDNNPKNRKVYVCHNGNTICVSVSSWPEHQAHGDYLGPCTSNRIAQREEINVTTPSANNALKSFNLIFAPNPSGSDFRLKVESNSNEPINIRVIDAFGRVMTVMNNVKKNSPVIFGENYRSGYYFVEVVQGANHKTVKLIKLN
jgi:hypothetical protein